MIRIFFRKLSEELVFAVVGETHEPEHKDEDHEEYRVDNPHEFQANPPPVLLVSRGVSVFLSPPPDLTVPLSSQWSEGLDVGLHDDVHERFEETEDEPAVDHLDVGGVGEIIAHTHNQYLSNKKVGH